MLGGEARELAGELEKRRLAVSRDGDELFVYASSPGEAVRAGEIIDAVLREQGIEAKTSQIEHWLDAEDRWDDEPRGRDLGGRGARAGLRAVGGQSCPPVAPRGP